MKQGWTYLIAITLMASCGNSGNGESGNDSISTISGNTDTINGGDTTGLNVGAAQPVDSSNRLREPMGVEPGSRKSGVYDQIDTGTRRGVDTGARRGGQ